MGIQLELDSIKNFEPETEQREERERHSAHWKNYSSCEWISVPHRDIPCEAEGQGWDRDTLTLL